MPKKDVLTIETANEVAEALTVMESVSKTLTPEEIETYSDLTEEYLLSSEDISFETRLMALSALKTLSHLSGNKEPLYTQAIKFPLKQHRDIYYAVPFMSEISAKGNPLRWHQSEAKYILEQPLKKGNYSILRLMILLYESVLFQGVMDKQRRKNYFTLAEVIFKRIREHIQDLQTAYAKRDKKHHWLSLDKSSLLGFSRIVDLWKMIVDSTTVRHGPNLPPKFRRPHDKLPFEWRELIRIKKVNKISMINAIFPLRGLSSQCREIRTYSSFLLHQVCEEREGFLESFKQTQVEQHFLSRLRIAYRLKTAYPKLPDGLPDKFQMELFLVLIEQAINSLAKKHSLGSGNTEDLQAQFANFNEQVHTKDEIVIDFPDDDFEDENEESTEEVTVEPEADTEAEEPQIPKVNIETDFEPITNDMELGMGVQSMPFIFPFTYEEDQDEIPLEHIPSIRWDELKWSAMSAQGISLHAAETKLFISKLEIVHFYRYDVYAFHEIKHLKPFRHYLCFIGKVVGEDGVKYYIVKKGGKKSKKGKSIVYIEIQLTDEYLKNIEQAYFFIFPPPHSQHILVIPR